MPFRPYPLYCLLLFMIGWNSSSWAAEDHPNGAAGPAILIVASHSSGNEWSDLRVAAIRDSLRRAIADVQISALYLDARDTGAHGYAPYFLLRLGDFQRSRYDKIILLDDPALKAYLNYAGFLFGTDALAVDIKSAETIARARGSEIPLALMTQAISESAELARQVSGRNKLLLLHSETSSGERLKTQALAQLEIFGFEDIESRSWLAMRDSTEDYSRYAVLALDAPSALSKTMARTALAEYFGQRFEAFFCYVDYLRLYGCDGGAFVDVAALGENVAAWAASDAWNSAEITVPLIPSLHYRWLDTLPDSVIVEVLGVPGQQSAPRWLWGILTALVVLLVVGGTASWRHLKSKQRLIERAQRDADYDALTGLLSHRKIISTIDLLIQENRYFSLLYLDLNGFKAARDAFGQEHGDKLLREFATWLMSAAGTQSTVGRVGDGEFILIDTGHGAPREAAEDISEALGKPFVIEGHRHTLACSIGVACYPLHAQSTAMLMRCADAARHSARFDLAERVRIFDERMLEEQLRNNWISSELEAALADGGRGLSLHIQPIYSLHKKSVVAGEVLLRWEHSSQGMISPEVFIPVAEASDLIVTLGEWVIKSILGRMARERLFEKVDYLSINISAKQFSTRNFTENIIALTERHGIPPASLMFEMTEHVELLDLEAVQSEIHRLREAGFGVAVDDFGAGYTSLNLLRDMAFSCVKLDRSLTSGLCSQHSLKTRYIIQGVLFVTERMLQKTVIEGVETVEEHHQLSELSADLVQGFYYYRPMAWALFHSLVSSNTVPSER